MKIGNGASGMGHWKRWQGKGENRDEEVAIAGVAGEAEEERITD